jgi:3-deoxy-D-arabino-heptulosonate 7-phosphate (DAHP) synthase class II
MACSCIVCRYHVFHITQDDGRYEIWSHSQDAYHALARHLERTGKSVATVPIGEYRHDITQEELAELYYTYCEGGTP